MPNPPESAPTFSRSIQDYLSVGYLYLLLLGIISDSIFYSHVDINILSYATIVDIILSPINYLAKGVVFMLVILVFPLLSFFFISYQEKRNRKKNTSDSTVSQSSSILNKPSGMSYGIVKVIAPAIMVLAAYIGYAFGSGTKLQERIQTGDFTADHVVTFLDDEQLEVKLIGQNSQYLFYVLKGEAQVRVSPIPGTVKSIARE